MSTDSQDLLAAYTYDLDGYVTSKAEGSDVAFYDWIDYYWQSR